jgi:hypothetical protein
MVAVDAFSIAWVSRYVHKPFSQKTTGPTSRCYSIENYSSHTEEGIYVLHNKLFCLFDHFLGFGEFYAGQFTVNLDGFDFVAASENILCSWRAYRN